MDTIKITNNLSFDIRKDGTVKSFTAHGRRHKCRRETRVRLDENRVLNTLLELRRAGEDFSLAAVTKHPQTA
jgi:hypothetical protein